MATYGRWPHFLTGKRLRIYQKNLVNDGAHAVVVIIVGVFLNIYSEYTKNLYLVWGVPVVLTAIVVVYIYRYSKGHTVWQLRRQELKQGQADPQNILKGLKVRTEK